jgi:hypothetical protein
MPGSCSTRDFCHDHMLAKQDVAVWNCVRQVSLSYGDWITMHPLALGPACMSPENDWPSSTVRDYHTWTAASQPKPAPVFTSFVTAAAHLQSPRNTRCSFLLSLLNTRYSLPRYAHKSSALYRYRRRTAALVQVKAAYRSSLVRSTASTLCYIALTCTHPHSLLSLNPAQRTHNHRSTSPVPNHDQKKARRLTQTAWSTTKMPTII